MNTIKAIETSYKGYRFRSRLEARWAVFFDAVGLDWVYEPEGFTLQDGVRYLPDFYLPQWECWVEVKPALPNEDEVYKFWQLAASNKNSDKENHWKQHIMLCGTPGFPQIDLAMDGEPPFIRPGCSYFALTVSGIIDNGKPLISFAAFAATQGGKGFDIWPIYFAPEDDFLPLPCTISPVQTAKNQQKLRSLTLYHGIVSNVYVGDGVYYKTPKIAMAYNAARSARFEHGENP